MAPTRRWAAAVGVVLALLTVAGPASAKSTAMSFNSTAQEVGVGKWQVVIVPGTAPATAPAPPATFDVSLVTPTYLTLTNIGTVTPGTMTVVVGAGLTLVSGVQICLVPWVGASCAQPMGYVGNSFVAGTPQAPPAPGKTWYLRAVGVLALGVTMSAVTTAPAGKSLNS